MDTKDFTWSFFEKTGNIETFLEYNQMKNSLTGEENESNFHKGNDNQGG